jgi:hypothetical protein
MKYDDASWHYGGKFPKDSPETFGGTHIALLLKWCFMKGWAGTLHVQENEDDVNRLRSGAKQATDFLFQWCDGKFTSEDLNEEGNAFIGVYYGKGGEYLNDYATTFSKQMYVAAEAEHDFKLFSGMVDRRYKSYLKSTRRPWWRLR